MQEGEVGTEAVVDELLANGEFGLRFWRGWRGGRSEDEAERGEKELSRAGRESPPSASEQNFEQSQNMVRAK
jgi:hypothetical protein